MRDTMLLILFFVLFSIGGVTASTAQQDNSTAPAFRLHKLNADWTHTVASDVEPQPLDSPLNPWRDDYGPWDVWWFNHIYEAESPDNYFEDRDIDFTAVYFNESGFAIPHRILHDWRIEGKQGTTIGDMTELSARPAHILYVESLPRAYSVTAMEPELKEEFSAYKKALFNEKYPVVQDWILEYKPAVTVFLPDGYVALKFAGQLLVSPTDSTYTQLVSVWYLFDLEGNQIDPPNPGIRQSDWSASATDYHELFWDTWAVGSRMVFGRYTFIYENQDTRTNLLQIIDYDGTELPVNDATLGLPLEAFLGYSEELDFSKLWEIAAIQSEQLPSE